MSVARAQIQANPTLTCNIRFTKLKARALEIFRNYSCYAGALYYEDKYFKFHIKTSP